MIALSALLVQVNLNQFIYTFFSQEIKFQPADHFGETMLNNSQQCKGTNDFINIRLFLFLPDFCFRSNKTWSFCLDPWKSTVKSFSTVPGCRWRGLICLTIIMSRSSFSDCSNSRDITKTNKVYVISLFRCFADFTVLLRDAFALQRTIGSLGLLENPSEY